MLIAIDGTAASGKGTLGKLLSKKLNIPYLDTGLLYRKIAFVYVKKSPEINSLKNLNLPLLYDILDKVNFEDLNPESLKGELYGMYASKIAKFVKVRKKLKSIQIDFSNQMLEEKGGCILDGRDIGTVIIPNAQYKFFVDATLEIRAKRRYEQLINTSEPINYKDILKNLKKRDNSDMNRLNSPLKPAFDAVYIDSSSITPEIVAKIALTYIKKI